MSLALLLSLVTTALPQEALLPSKASPPSKELSELRGPDLGGVVQRLTWEGDLDGDGADDFSYASTEFPWCGSGSPRGTWQTVSGRKLERIRRLRGPFDHHVSRSSLDPGRWLVFKTGDHQSHTSMRTDLDEKPERVIWDHSPDHELSLDPFFQTDRLVHFLDDVGGDGIEDLFVANAWDRGETSVRTPEGAEGRLGVRSGEDGSFLWKRYGDRSDLTFGFRATVVGDADGDDCNDVFVLSIGKDELWVHLISGRNGRTLDERSLRGFGHPFEIPAVGDLDGDGVQEVFVSMRILSPRTMRPLFEELGPVLWAAAWNSAGEGPGLLLGTKRGVGQRQIHWATVSGTRVVTRPHSRDPAWNDAMAIAGDFDGDGHVDLLWSTQVRKSQRWSSSPLLMLSHVDPEGRL